MIAPNLGQISSALEAYCPTCFAKPDATDARPSCPTCGGEYAVRSIPGDELPDYDGGMDAPDGF